MPYGNVSDIIMTRNPVEEAQRWKEIRLKEKELAMKQEETRKKLTPQPYDFDFNEYGTANPYQQDFVADLEDMDYQLTLADMEYLET